MRRPPPGAADDRRRFAWLVRERRALPFQDERFGGFGRWGFRGEWLRGRRLARRWFLVGDAVEGLVGLTLTMVSPADCDGLPGTGDVADRTGPITSPGGEGSIERPGVFPPDVKRQVPGSDPPGCGGVCWSRASSDAHIQRGESHDTVFDRRPPFRRAWQVRSSFASAVMLMPAAISSRRRRDARLRLVPAERVSHR